MIMTLTLSYTKYENGDAGWLKAFQTLEMITFMLQKNMFY